MTSLSWSNVGKHASDTTDLIELMELPVEERMPDQVWCLYSGDNSPMTRLAHIADRVLNRPLMILPDKLSLIASVLDGRIGIDAKGFDDIEADYLRSAPEASRFVGQVELNDPNNPAAGKKPYRTTPEGVAIIPVMGSLVNRGGWIGAYSGMTSYEGLKHQLSAAAGDPAVSSIILDMDSPGGEAVGAFEAGDAVRQAAQLKEVVAIVNGMAASAAYAIASAATKIVVTSSGIAGSIGVVMLHADYSNKLHQAGIVPTMIFAGARKVDGNPYEKLTAEVKGELSAEINRFYDLFVSSVAKGRRGMTEDAIRATEARTYIGADAVAIGLADEVGTFESALADLSRRAPPARSIAKTRGSFMQTERTFTSQQFGEAIVNARQSERDRIRAILSLPEARSKEAAALSIATTSGATVEDAKLRLKSAETSPANLSASWDQALKRAGFSLPKNS
ncbi:signal peptide peptidase SppA [Nitrobacteraceae bacterium AZCC 2146]